jgi:hypothetical protein
MAKHYFLIEIDTDDTRPDAKAKIGASLSNALWYRMGEQAKIYEATSVMRQMINAWPTQRPRNEPRTGWPARAGGKGEAIRRAHSYAAAPVEYVDEAMSAVEDLPEHEHPVFEKGPRVKWDSKLDDGHQVPGYVPRWERPGWDDPDTI